MLRTLLDAWARDMERRGLSSLQRSRSVATVSALLDALGGDDVSDLTALGAMRWLDGCGWRGRTLRNRTSMIRGFGEFVALVGATPANPLRPIRLPRNGPCRGADPMTLEQLRRLLAIGREADSSDDGRRGRWGPLRETVYLVLAMTGLRIGELAVQKWADTDLVAGILRLTADKARRNDVIPIPDEAIEAFASWRRWSGGELVFPVLPSHHTIANHLTAAGIVGRGRWHRLRKFAVVERARRGVDYRRLSRFIRHSDLGTTLRHYDLVLCEELREVANAIPRVNLEKLEIHLETLRRVG